MYQKIVVPLDGSDLAECVLPHVEAIAQGCQAKEVIFVRVVEPIAGETGQTSFVMSFIPEHDRIRLEEETQTIAEDYMKQMVDRVNLAGTAVRWEIIRGQAAESLSSYAAKNKADLIIIATHGRGGISRWVMGSVTDRLLRSSCVPVFMIRAPGCVAGI